jgi:hypothetical protein
VKTSEVAQRGKIKVCLCQIVLSNDKPAMHSFGPIIFVPCSILQSQPMLL